MRRPLLLTLMLLLVAATPAAAVTIDIGTMHSGPGLITGRYSWTIAPTDSNPDPHRGLYHFGAEHGFRFDITLDVRSDGADGTTHHAISHYTLDRMTIVINNDLPEYAFTGPGNGDGWSLRAQGPGGLYFGVCPFGGCEGGDERARFSSDSLPTFALPLRDADGGFELPGAFSYAFDTSESAQIVAVPEPSTLVFLLTLSLVGGVLILWRR